MPNIRGFSLALFGRIDQMAIEADRRPSPENDAVIETIERFLPNSTGLGQRGWFLELQDFLNSPSVRATRSGSGEPYAFPTYAEAVNGLGEVQPVADRSASDLLPLDDDRHPALARAAYASLIIEKVRAIQDPSSAGPITRANALFDVLPGILDPWPAARAGRMLSAGDKFDALVGRFDEMVDRESFVRIASEEISPGFAERSKPCFGTLLDAGGEYCSTLYTDSTDDDLTVDDVKRIIHPLNWDLCCPSFFHQMAEQTPGRFTKDGWVRIVESISAEPDEYLLHTALVFSLEEREFEPGQGKGIAINYKLDTNRSGEGLSAGIVEIDNGYLWVTPTGTGPDGKGVRIRTSKQERVNGLSPTATSALGCLLGWSDAGKEMLAGAARKAMDGTLPLPAGRELVGWPAAAAKVGPTDQGPPTVPPDVPARLPINFGDTVGEGRDLAKGLVDKVTSNLGDALSRWMNGLTKHDVEAITGKMGEDAKAWSVEVYETAERNVRPARDGAVDD